MNIQARKQALRQSIIAAREKLPVAERLRLSRAIVESTRNLPVYRQARTVLGYLNFGAELVAELWVRQALADGKQVLLPRVNRASRHLDLYRVQDLEHDVAPGSWGIREPVAERCIKEEALGTVEFILFPAWRSPVRVHVWGTAAVFTTNCWHKCRIGRLWLPAHSRYK